MGEWSERTSQKMWRQRPRLAGTSGLPAAVVCLWAILSGCGTTTQAPDFYRFGDHLATDAIVSAPAVVTTEQEAPPLEWNFSKIGGTWLSMRGMVGFTPKGELAVKGENGKSPLIVSPEKPPIDWTHYETLVIRMVAGGGEHIKLRFQQQEYVQKLAPPMRYRVYRFDLNLNTPSFKGRLIIEPTDSTNQTALIDYIKLIPRKITFPKPAGVCFPGKRSEYRRAIYAHAPSSIRYRVGIPERATLRFGVGVLAGSDPLTFRIRAGEGGEVLFTKEVNDPGRWKEAAVDLTGYGGESLDLVFETEGRQGAVGFWATPVLSTASRRSKPNIVLYLVDTLRADHTSLYGYTRETTPNLKRLGSEGIVFEDCQSQSTWTKPSVASLLTSLHTLAHGMQAFIDTIPPGAVTLAQSIRKHGYVTASILANPFSGRNSGLDRGVDHLFEHPALNPFRRPEERASDSAALNRVALPWIEAHREEPFFLYLHSTDPHYPYQPPAAEEARFANPAETAAFDHDYDILSGAVGTYAGGAVFNRATARAKGVDPDRWVRRALDRYDAEIAFNDKNIGRLIDKLRELGILDNTLVVIVSDHGEEFLEHGWTTHGHSLYNELTHVVCLLWNRKLIPTPRRVTEPVQLIDVMPTLLDLLGIRPEGIQEGQSLLPLIRGEKFERNGAVMASRLPEDGPPPPGGGIPENRIGTVARTNKQWKLIYREHGKRVGLKKVELYERLSDPHEKRDVAPNHPEIVQPMLDRTIEWIRQQRRLHQILGEGEKGKLDTATLERLRTLGYIGGGAAATSKTKPKE